MNINTKKMVLSAMFLAIGLILPFFTGQIQQIGNMLLPMHIPVLLCGIICGWAWGGLVGFTLPLLRSALFGMPIFFPNACAMAFELATYGILIALAYRLIPWNNLAAHLLALLIAMIGGRIVWGCAMVLFLSVGESSFTWALFLGGAFFNAIPGIILQLVCIPLLTHALERANLLPLR